MNTQSFQVGQLILTLSAAVGLLIAAWNLSLNYYLDQAKNTAQLRTNFHSASLSAALERYQHLPFILSRDPFVRDALGSSVLSTVLNHRLEQFATESKADAIYLMDKNGDTIAASNWQTPNSFLGQNYSFRPYFQKALAGDTGEFFAIGATTHIPGYFVSVGVRDKSKRIAGVIAVKVDLRPLEQSWRQSGENLFVSNPDGVITLSSQSSWRYQTVKPLDDSSRQKIAERRQFADSPLQAIDISRKENYLLTIDGLRHIESIARIDGMGWTVHYLSKWEDVLERARPVVLVVAGIELLMLLVWMGLRSQRIRAALLSSQRDSETLRKLNSALQEQIDERTRAEQALKKTQRELQQASKLAALGQFSASVTHELSQPLAAMNTYLASARLPGEDPTEAFDRIKALTSRMDKITHQLKFFARKSDEVLVDVNLSNVIDNSVKIASPQLEQDGIECSVSQPTRTLIVRGDSIRLEQVVLNVINNARDALRNNDTKTIHIDIKKRDDNVVISISDNGPGFDKETLQHMFEPFYTTKPSGEGTGLGLAIASSIVRELDGEIEASNSADGGATITIKFPLAETSDTHSAENDTT